MMMMMMMMMMKMMMMMIFSEITGNTSSHTDVRTCISSTNNALDSSMAYSIHM
jgi:hypothetical protein